MVFDPEISVVMGYFFRFWHAPPANAVNRTS